MPVRVPPNDEPLIVRYHADTRHELSRAIDSWIVGLIGLAWMTIGLTAVTRAGVDGPLSLPVVEVLGLTHTATLGAVEITAGVCLIVCSVTTNRSASTFFGFVLEGAGIVAVVQTDSFRRSLALDARLAWITVVTGTVVVVVSALMPRIGGATLPERSER